jgi:4-alpha-glucanotransferase
VSDLDDRAAAAGVAVTYDDWAGRTIRVPPEVVEAVLRQVGEPGPHEEHDQPALLPPAPRCWGWQVQLYALHSDSSWGIGDYGDLRDLAVWAAGEGAGTILVNPLHAVAPVHPVQNSPYSPTSRRYLDPLSVRVTGLPEYTAADAQLRARVDALRPAPGPRIDRDAVWDAKSQALGLLAPAAVELDANLAEFALFCALAEQHGLPFQRWPPALANREPAALAAAAEVLADRVAFHGWLQQRCAEQVADAQDAALAAGMSVGIVHDLAVGVDPGGADAWLLADVLASEVSVGAPPDSFNQQGQDWALPPWSPGALARANYGPLRAMLDAVLSRGGGVRIDHVMGLFRLWWIPPGVERGQGAFVSYDAAAMLDTVVRSALATGGVVVGEDLGTVEPGVREALGARGVLGSAVLWFERADDDPEGPPKAPAEWREEAMASISTHDLPTAYGLLAGEQVRVRAELGLLTDVEAERSHAAREKTALLESLITAGALDAGDADDPRAVVLAMHRLLAMTPCRIVLASPYDVIGELRQPNLPGTTDAYPNWTIPLPLSLEELAEDERVADTAAVLRAARP